MKIGKKLQGNTLAMEHLTFQQLANRERNIVILNEYRRRGLFPLNTKYKDQTVPQIRDAFGTHCAMANLLNISGEDELVDTLESTNNRIRIDDVNDGPLIKWLENQGLTKKEATHIQPSYGHYESATSTLEGKIIVLSALFYFMIVGYFIGGVVGKIKIRNRNSTDDNEFVSEGQVVSHFKAVSYSLYLYLFFVTISLLGRIKITVNDKDYFFITLEPLFGDYNGTYQVDFLWYSLYVVVLFVVAGFTFKFHVNGLITSVTFNIIIALFVIVCLTVPLFDNIDVSRRSGERILSPDPWVQMLIFIVAIWNLIIAGYTYYQKRVNHKKVSIG